MILAEAESLQLLFQSSIIINPGNDQDITLFDSISNIILEPNKEYLFGFANETTDLYNYIELYKSGCIPKTQLWITSRNRLMKKTGGILMIMKYIEVAPTSAPTSAPSSAPTSAPTAAPTAPETCLPMPDNYIVNNTTDNGSVFLGARFDSDGFPDLLYKPNIGQTFNSLNYTKIKDIKLKTYIDGAYPIFMTYYIYKHVPGYLPGSDLIHSDTTEVSPGYNDLILGNLDIDITPNTLYNIIFGNETEDIITLTKSVCMESKYIDFSAIGGIEWQASPGSLVMSISAV